MKIFRCSIYKICGAQPPAEITQAMLNNGCSLVVSRDLNHIHVDYFRAAILPQILLSGIFHQAPGLNDSNDLDQRAAAYRENFVSTEIGACYLTVFSKSEEDLPIAEPNRQLGPYLIAVLNASAPTSSQIFHTNAVNSAISALAVSTRNMDRAEKKFEATYRTDSESRYVHYCSVSAHGEASAISQLPDDFSNVFRTISERLAEHQGLVSVFRLLTSSYTQHSDKLASFLAAWSAFEIFVNKSFPSQEAKLFASIEASHADFSLRLREVMKDKYRLADKFALLSSSLSPETAAGDIKAFRNFKKVRDELLHGGDIETRRLPIESIQALLRRYLLLYIGEAQT